MLFDANRESLGPVRRSASRVSPETPKNIVAIGGGTGLPAVLSGLKKFLNTSEESPDRLTAIVTVTDDGGSSGRLRRDFGILPPGDVRNCLAALAPDGSPFADLIQHRFACDGELSGHSLGNLLLAAMTQMTGDFQAAIERLGALMQLRGSVLPSTLENVVLRADFDSGESVTGETAIVQRGRRIKRLCLERPARPLPQSIRALINADVIVVGPGSLYTSVLPNLLIDGIASTISGLQATRIYVANLMTEPGETDGFTLEDHMAVLRDHVGLDLFDYILVNSRPIPHDVGLSYASRGSLPVQRASSSASIGPARIVERDLAWQVDRGKIRHGQSDLARAVVETARLHRVVHASRRPLGVAGRVLA